MKEVLLIFSCALISSTLSRRISTYSCQTVRRLPNFDVSQFIGTWYIINTYFDKSLLYTRCPVLTFSWPAVNTNTSDMTVFRKVIAFGVERKFIGSVFLVAPGLLFINYPALSMGIFLKILYGL